MMRALLKRGLQQQQQHRQRCSFVMLDRTSASSLSLTSSFTSSSTPTSNEEKSASLDETKKRQREEEKEKEDHASFGYKSVPKTKKESLVRDVFESVAPSYDVMNDLTVSYTHLTLPTILRV